MDVKNDKYALVSVVAIIAIVGIVAILVGSNKVSVVSSPEELGYANTGGQVIRISVVDKSVESDFEESDLTKYLLSENIVKKVMLNGCDTLEILNHDRLVETGPGVFTVFDSNGEPLSDESHGYWQCSCYIYNNAGPFGCDPVGPQECEMWGTCTECRGRFVGGASSFGISHR